jgi:phosphatidylinositol glycan class O
MNKKSLNKLNYLELTLLLNALLFIKMNTFKSILLVLLFLGHVIISLYTFTNGFLIRRISLNFTNSNSFEKLKKFDKAIVLFVDALRFDFIFTKHGERQNDYFGLPTIETLVKQRSNARLYKFIADPPTTTMQRIKALMSGTLPTFIDAGSNFDSYIIEDDTLIKQAFMNNKSVVILGDDTWLSLFEPHMIEKHYTYPSFNIKDLDTNDQYVDEHLENIFKEKDKIKWNLLIAHYLGLDHCGHSFGPKSPVIKRKLKDIDDSIR